MQIPQKLWPTSSMHVMLYMHDHMTLDVGVLLLETLLSAQDPIAIVTSVAADWEELPGKLVVL